MSNLNIRYGVLFLAAIVFQLTLVKYIQVFNWSPDLILIVLVSYSLRKGPNLGMTAGFLTGLLQDLLSTQFLGLIALSKTIAGFIAGSLAGKFSQKTEFFLTLVIASLAHDFCYFLIYTFGENFSFQSLFILYTIPNVLYTILIGGFLHYLTAAWVEES